MKLSEEFSRVIKDPYDYERKLKKEKKIVGTLCSYAPEEIIIAAGAHPFRLFDSGQKGRFADAHLQSYCCSLVRGILEDALAGRLEFLDGTVFPHTCDSMQRLSDIFRMNGKYLFFADVVLPAKLNTESAKIYMADILASFKNGLETAVGHEI